MNEKETQYQELVEALSQDRRVNKSSLQTIIAQKNSGTITLDQSLERLRALEEMPFFHGDPSVIHDEWKELTKIIEASQDSIKEATRLQARIGVFSLPLFVIVVIVGTFLGGFSKEINSLALPILGATLAAIIIHTFYILRTQQQSSIAMERLAEKRLGILFLKLAAGSNPKEVEFKQLIEAGVKMFLEHHAPTAIALSPEDAKAVAGQLFNMSKPSKDAGTK